MERLGEGELLAGITFQFSTMKTLLRFAIQHGTYSNNTVTVPLNISYVGRSLVKCSYHNKTVGGFLHWPISN